MARPTRYVALLAAVALLATVPGAGSAAKRRYRYESARIAPGTRFIRISDPSGPYRIRIVTARLAAETTMDVALATDKLPGFETTSSMAARHGAIAAINGDYARPSGRPVMTFAEDGSLVQTPLAWGRNFSVSRDELAAYIGHPEVSVTLTDGTTGAGYVVAAVNNGMASSFELSAFTADGGREERPPRNACAARLYPVSAPRLRSDGFPGVEQDLVVDESRCAVERMAVRGGIVVVSPVGGSYQALFETLVPGAEMSLAWSLGWPSVVDTLGGNPTLIENGSIVGRNVDGEGAFFGRHPRTGVGVTATGKVLFVTVDGRQDRSVGMTPREFAELFAELGAEWALNLDGGGSTTMVVGGRIVNRPSDGPERPVSSALLVLPGTDLGEATPTPTPTPVTSPTATPTPTPSETPGAVAAASPGAVWLAMAADGGSVGGLAQFLSSRSIRLAPFLERALALLRGR